MGRSTFVWCDTEYESVYAKLAALGAFLPSVRASYSYSKGKETDIDPANVRGLDYVDVIDSFAVPGGMGPIAGTGALIVKGLSNTL